jgi:hypothetical protein
MTIIALVFQVGSVAFVDGWSECGGVGVKRIAVFGLPLSKYFRGSVVYCLSDVVPLLFVFAIRRFWVERLQKGLGKLHHLVGEGSLAPFNTRSARRSSSVNLLRPKSHIAANQRVLGVAVSAVKGAGKEDKIAW